MRAKKRWTGSLGAPCLSSYSNHFFSGQIPVIGKLGKNPSNQCVDESHSVYSYLPPQGRYSGSRVEIMAIDRVPSTGRWLGAGHGTNWGRCSAQPGLGNSSGTPPIIDITYISFLFLFLHALLGGNDWYRWVFLSINCPCRTNATLEHQFNQIVLWWRPAHQTRPAMSPAARFEQPLDDAVGKQSIETPVSSDERTNISQIACNHLCWLETSWLQCANSPETWVPLPTQPKHIPCRWAVKLRQSKRGYFSLWRLL